MMALSLKKLDRICLTIVILAVIVCGYAVASWAFKQQKLIQQENAMQELESLQKQMQERFPQAVTPARTKVTSPSS